MSTRHSLGRRAKAEEEAQIAKVIEVLEKYEDKLLSLPNVVGLGRGEKEGEPCLEVYVERKVSEDELSAVLKAIEIEGVKTHVVESGRFDALEKKEEIS